MYHELNLWDCPPPLHQGQATMVSASTCKQAFCTNTPLAISARRTSSLTVEATKIVRSNDVFFRLCMLQMIMEKAEGTRIV